MVNKLTNLQIIILKELEEKFEGKDFTKETLLMMEAVATSVLEDFSAEGNRPTRMSFDGGEDRLIGFSVRLGSDNQPYLGTVWEEV